MSVAALGRDYPSIWSRPVIRAVDMRIFWLRYFRRCLQCDFCADQCCNYGVDIDVENVARLLAQGPAFDDYVGQPRSQWFSGEPVADPEFPGGANLRTGTVDGHCVFRSAAGRGCRIHAFCLENGLDYHMLKPMVSTLFPLTFEHGVLMPSGEVLDQSLVCAGDGDSLYAGARDELSYYFGGDLVAALDALAVPDAR
jgi:hypothetical protein